MRIPLRVLFPIFLLRIFCCFGQAVDTTLWVTDGSVYTVARSGNTVYLGGAFSYVGPNTGNGAAIDANTGQLSTGRFAHVNDDVRAVVPDGKGGWFIGGAFTRVQGVPRYKVAHLLADGSLDQAWTAHVNEDDLTNSYAVYALYLHGDNLYIGGYFTKVQGQPRNYLAVVEASTGRLSDWNLNAGGSVHTMTAANGMLYLGGSFRSMGGAGRFYCAAIDLATRRVAPWNPAPNMTVNAIVVAGNLVYLGGLFTTVGNQTRNYLAAVTLDTGQLTAWNPNPSRQVEVLALRAGVLYAGGGFAQVANETRHGLAAFDAASGQLLPWNPGFLSSSSVYALLPTDNFLYVGGGYVLPEGYLKRLAAFDLRTAQRTAWDPMPTSTVLALAGSGNALYAGGAFNSIGGYSRVHLAAVDAATGVPTNWNAFPDGAVRGIIVHNNTVYFNGYFTSVSGQPRSEVAAVDATTGLLLPWNLKVDAASVYCLAASDYTIYLGGSFWQVGGASRRSLAAVDATTGSLRDWDPSLTGGGYVYALKVVGSHLYVGGSFATIGGQTRNNLAAVDLRSAQVTPWNPNVTGTVKSLAATDTTLYATGAFTAVRNQTRSNAAAIDLRTGMPTAWNPQVNNIVESVALLGNQVYLGGPFTAVNGQPRQNLAAVGIRDHTLSSWAPQLYASSEGIVYSLSAYDGMLYAGGAFSRVDARSVSNFAAFGDKPVLPNLIRGNIFVDENGDCRKNEGERPFLSVVKAEPGSYYGFADSLGNYTLAVDTGTYAVAQVLPADKGKAIAQTCPASPATHTVAFKTYGNTAAGLDFGNRVSRRPYLTAGVASTRRRRCFSANTMLTYCNEGTLPVDEAKVHLELPEHVVLVSASLPYVRDSDRHYVFNVGDLPAGYCSTIQVKDSVACDDPDIRGVSQCTKVWITPANVTTPAPGWDQSEVALKARCLTNGRVRLGLYNTGTGAMRDSSAFRVLLDARLVLSRRFKLAAGDSLILQVTADGQTVRLEADQRPGHPAKQSANVTIEGCGRSAGGKVSRGFVSQLPPDDAEPEVDVECLPVTDSYDPNDKLVLPAGLSSEHLTAFGQELEYTVRFQNTGNDYAYRVIITDTLSEKLDLRTLRVAGASHPYTFTVAGQGRPVLTWTFKDINLPDSTRDQAGSNGFVKFTVHPLDNLPAGTRIENSADIFFDFNPPVRTNTVFNTLGELPREADGAPAAEIAICQFNPVPAAGAGRVLCEGDSVQLQARAPQYGQGLWKRISGTGTLREPANPYAFVTGLGYGDNVFEWQVVRGSCTDDSLSARVTITRHRSPAKPVIRLVENNELACDPEAGQYQWYHNGQLLPEGGRRIRADREGNYTVRISDGVCPSPLSDAYAFVLTALTDPAQTSPVLLHPNPTDGVFTVTLPAGVMQATLTVFDALGRKVFQKVTGGTGHAGLRQPVDLRPNGAGVYVVRIETPKAVVTKRIVLGR